MTDSGSGGRAGESCGLRPLRVADVGAADHPQAHAFVDRQYVAFAVDLDAALLSRISEDGIVPVCSDGGRLPFRDRSLDLLLLLEVLEHVDDPGRVLSEAGRVLTTRGELVVAVPTHYTEVLYSRLHPRYARNAGHVRIWRTATLRQMIEERGFRIERARAANFVPAVSWLFHALLRSEADHTGRILEHKRVDRMINLGVARARSWRYTRAALAATEARVGKSLYLYATKLDVCQ
jgi:SAM-dependent methyltransferase